MPASDLARKLLLKPGMSACLLNAPPGYNESLQPLPEGVTVSDAGRGQFDFLQLFASSKTEIDASAATALGVLKPDALLWVAFPKGSSRVQTDLTRDKGWDAFNDAGWRIVSLISVDETWSAARLRPGVNPRRRVT